MDFELSNRTHWKVGFDDLILRYKDRIECIYSLERANYLANKGGTAKSSSFSG